MPRIVDMLESDAAELKSRGWHDVVLPPGAPDQNPIAPPMYSPAPGYAALRSQMVSSSSQSGEVRVRMAKLFYPERIAIPEKIARRIDITDLVVGNRSQVKSGVVLPGEMFAISPLAQIAAIAPRDRRLEHCGSGTINHEYGAPFVFETAWINMDLVIQYRVRPGIEPVPFQAFVLGMAAVEAKSP